MRGGAGRGGAGRGESKKSKPIPAPPRGAGLKACLISAPPPLQGRENPCGAKWGGAGQAGRGKIAIPISERVSVHLPLDCTIPYAFCLYLQSHIHDTK